MADLYRDFVFTRCTTPVGAADTAITVEDVSLFPSNNTLARGEFYVAFESTLGYPHTFEICRLTNVNAGSKTLTLVRGQAGTTAVAHAIITYIKGTLTSDMLRRARTGFAGTLAPSPDLDVFAQGDRFFHTTENRYYAYTGRAGWLVDTFTRAASLTTLGSTEAVNGVPYVGVWQANGVWGINASGQAYYVSGAVSNIASAMLNIGGLDFDVSFDVWASTTAGSDYGIIFRSNTDFTTGYYLQFNGTTAALYRVSGTFTATGNTTVYTTGSKHTWRITAIGNAITVYLDGVIAIQYTEATPALLVTAGNVGASVGMRIGNAAGVSDTSLYWDNFKATYPGNTAPNNPVLQGWAASDIFAQNTLSEVESSLTTVVQHLDDVIAADANVESTVLKHDVDLTAIYSTLDDLLPVLQEHDGHLTDLALTDATIATQVDELLDALLGSSTTSGTGPPPSGVASVNSLYVDSYSKRLYLYTASGWTPVTYSGPVTGTANIVERPVRSAYSNSVTLPTGSQAGDFAVWAQTQRNSTSTYLTPPTGFTVQAQGYGPNQYWSSWSVSTKILTAADITAGVITGPAYEDACVLRVFNFGAYDVSVAGVGNAGYPNMYQTVGGYVATAPSVTTTGVNDVVISTFFSVGYSSPNFSSVSGGLSNVAFINGSQVSIYSGDEIVAAPGATTARTATANGAGLEVGACTLAIRVAAPAPVPTPMAVPTAIKTAAYTALPGDLVLCNATSAAFTVTLPSASIIGTTVLVKKTDASVNAVTVAGAGASVIDGVGTFTLRNQYDSVSVVADGTNWWVA